MITLSICIPVFNRKHTLKILLDSIIDQLDSEDKETVEVAISDNASTDGTEELVKKYIASHPDIKIVYSKNKRNLGPDRNYMMSVNIAHGKYAWIVGSDDALYAGAVKKMLAEIQLQHTVYLASRDEYDVSLTQFRKRVSFFKPAVSENMTIFLNSRENWDFYLNSCAAIGGVMSYLSSIVFEKGLWDSVKDYRDYIGTAYVHVYIILKFLLENKNASIRLLAEPLVKCRIGNDSFFRTLYQRTMLDFNGYIKLSELFEDPLLKQDFLLILKKTYPVIPIRLILQMNCREWKHLECAMRAAGYSEGEIQMAGRLRRHKLLALLLHSNELAAKIKRTLHITKIIGS